MNVLGVIFGLILLYLIARLVLWLSMAIIAANNYRKKAKADYREMLDQWANPEEEK